MNEAAAMFTATDDEAGDTSAMAMELAILKEQLVRAERRVEELTALADRDPLVGVLNRRAFTREAARAVAGRARHGHASVLVAVDIEGLGEINERYGKAAGDAALAQVGQTVSGHVRTTDAVGRLCEDEFAVLLAFANEDGAAAKMERLAGRIAREPVEVLGEKVPVRIRFAVAAVEGESGAEDQLALLSVKLHQSKAVAASA